MEAHHQMLKVRSNANFKSRHITRAGAKVKLQWSSHQKQCKSEENGKNLPKEETVNLEFCS
jgi:hypothetical protein